MFGEITMGISPIAGEITTYSSGWWLSPTPLKNMSSSVGMMTFPTECIKFSSKPPTSHGSISSIYIFFSLNPTFWL